MEQKTLPNNGRNLEVAAAIKKLEGLDLGTQSQKHIGIAETLSSLNVAESLQMLQLQITVTAAENRKAIESQVNKLIDSNTKLAASNEKSSNRMVALTGSLVFVGLLQAIIIFISWYYR